MGLIYSSWEQPTPLNGVALSDGSVHWKACRVIYSFINERGWNWKLNLQFLRLVSWCPPIHSTLLLNLKLKLTEGWWRRSGWRGTKSTIRRRPVLVIPFQWPSAAEDGQGQTISPSLLSCLMMASLFRFVFHATIHTLKNPKTTELLAVHFREFWNKFCTIVSNSLNSMPLTIR